MIHEIDLSDHDKRVLNIIGQNPYGKELVGILQRAKEKLCSIENLEPGGDHNAQVEGRLLFKAFADEIMKALTFEKRGAMPRKPVDFSS